MERSSFASSIAGLSVLGGFLIGIAGLVFAVFAVINNQDYVGSGLCLLASAVSLGLLSNALFRR